MEAWQKLASLTEVDNVLCYSFTQNHCPRLDLWGYFVLHLSVSCFYVGRCTVGRVSLSDRAV